MFFLQISIALFFALFAVVSHGASIPNAQESSNPSDLIEIEVDAAPESGAIQGLRLKRSGDLGENLPEIDIEKIDNDVISVNGVRLKRSELKDLSDVDLDEEATEDDASGERTRRSGGGDLLGFLGQKLGQKISAFASASSGHNSEAEVHYGAPVTVKKKQHFLRP